MTAVCCFMAPHHMPPTGYHHADSNVTDSANKADAIKGKQREKVTEQDMGRVDIRLTSSGWREFREETRCNKDAELAFGRGTKV